MRVRVIGVGTPFGDDAVGPAVVARLAAEGLPAGVEAVFPVHPHGLPDALEGCEAAVLVDASRTELAPGTVHEPAPAALRAARALSSHGLGVAEALALAEALGRAPQGLAVVAVEAASLAAEGLSGAVRAALPEAARRVRARVAAFAEALDAAHGRRARGPVAEVRGRA